MSGALSLRPNSFRTSLKKGLTIASVRGSLVAPSGPERNLFRCVPFGSANIQRPASIGASILVPI